MEGREKRIPDPFPATVGEYAPLFPFVANKVVLFGLVGNYSIEMSKGNIQCKEFTLEGQRMRKLFVLFCC